jgi:hypothetical protein
MTQAKKGNLGMALGFFQEAITVLTIPLLVVEK